MMTSLNPAQASEIFFTQSSEQDNWFVINDTVMGGESQSHFAVREQNGIFSGYVSLENYGGFASVRRPMRLSHPSEQISLLVKGDGKTYQFRIRTNNLVDGIAYRVNFTTEKGVWQRINFHQQEFIATFRGRIITDAPPLKFSDIAQIGFLISQKQQGKFQLMVQSISFLQST
ncbi:CIA30 family protein [Thalassotalea aquiviva]|uniref:CIA30 family protein n=1 Tax=Thalassotalea aquiviva TaxID=3242415 RepID=UPI00352B8FCE